MYKVIIFILCILPVKGFAFTLCNTTSIIATTPTADFIDNGNGTVTHTKTGLMWKRCAEGETWSQAAGVCNGTASIMNWQAALQQAQTVNSAAFAGFNDWRLPNIKELASIIEEQCTSPSANTTIFAGTLQVIWSSTGHLSSAWNVDFNFGNSDFNPKASSYGVLLVRGGP